MRKFLGAALRRSGLCGLLRVLAARHRVTIVVYHDPSPEVLARHLAYYVRHYTVIPLDALQDERLPLYPLVVTFDDGHRGNLRLAAVLRRFGVRPTIYLCSRIVGTGHPFWWQTQAARGLGVEALKALPDAQRRECLGEAGPGPDQGAEPRQALSWEEVATLGAVADFGAHSRHHPVLPRCDDATCADEIILGKAELEAALGRPCRHFAYPNGSYGDREVALLRQAGFVTGRTLDAGWNARGTDPHRLKGVCVSDDAPVDWLAVQLTGLPTWFRQARGAFAVLAARIRGLARRDRRAAGESWLGRCKPLRLP